VARVGFRLLNRAEVQSLLALTAALIFWHRGFAISDIVLRAWIHEQAEAKGERTMLTLWNGPDE
jgi:hypothetical protein